MMITKVQQPAETQEETPSATFALRIARHARERYAIEDSQITIPGDRISADFFAARVLAEKINTKRDLLSHPEDSVDASEVNAISLIDEIMHLAISDYCLNTNPKLFKRMDEALTGKLGKQAIDSLLEQYTELVPPSAEIYTGTCDAKQYVNGDTQGIPHRYQLLEDMLVSWFDNKNPAAARLKEFFDDTPLCADSIYNDMFQVLPQFFTEEPSHTHTGKPLFQMLMEPILKHPDSLSDQLVFIQQEWGDWLQTINSRLLSSLDFIREEQHIRYDPQIFGPGPTLAPTFDRETDEPEHFSADLDWMPKVVLIAKNAAVWLDQLSKQYERTITTLSDIPDEALAELARRGFNALWLIGIWQRSPASERIKQMTGNPEAAASAYSLTAYRVDDALGGEAALEALRAKTTTRGMRLACDMVPNHMGLDSEWICEHPDWFIQCSTPPFPSYQFTGPDLSGDPRVRVHLEDGYWNRSDAAVVFQRVDAQNGDTHYIYHGNDGTHLPWNDTAQLNYLLPEVREAVIQQIIAIARQFPIIRFDAAMTLAKKHVQRLWYPEPGSGGDIASRSECGMTHHDFNKAFPREFWREVVDRVQQEAPDTLLLAEAFWMMEGYFVRSLGMHRVYNSAFMNMLKNEENGKYRNAMCNVLEFEPQIMKRYVNFMSNPDEETAIAQFGADDKYFGCCILMATLPGTPMFGHGQVEGFSEKYGMEYRRAYHDETPNSHLMERHQREIAPLLHKRHLFSEVEQFRLYDLVNDAGETSDDVFAYSNRAAHESCLVLYHNRFSEARGRIHTSVPFLFEGSLTQNTLAESLGIIGKAGTYIVFRDHITHTETIIESTELAEKGLPVLLSAFKYRVFLGFREAVNTPQKPYAELAEKLAGNGVPNIEIALDEHIHRHVVNALHESIQPAVLRALHESIQPAVLRALQCHADPCEVHTRLFNQLEILAAAVTEAESIPALAESDIEAITKQYAAAITLPLSPDRPSPLGATATRAFTQWVEPLADWLNGYQLNGWRVLIMLPFMKVLQRIYSKHNDPMLKDHFIRERFLDNVVKDVLGAVGATDAEIQHDIPLIHILTHLEQHLDITRPPSSAVYFERLFADVDVQRFLCINSFEGEVYFNKERFEQLVNWLAILVIADCLGNEQLGRRAQDHQIKALCTLTTHSTKVAKTVGYRLTPFLKAI